MRARCTRSMGRSIDVDGESRSPVAAESSVIWPSPWAFFVIGQFEPAIGENAVNPKPLPGVLTATNMRLVNAGLTLPIRTLADPHPRRGPAVSGAREPAGVRRHTSRLRFYPVGKPALRAAMGDARLDRLVRDLAPIAVEQRQFPASAPLAKFVVPIRAWGRRCRNLNRRHYGEMTFLRIVISL